MKKILIIHTGGTIAMSEDKATGGVNTGSGHPLDSFLPELNEIASIETDHYLNLPSPHITPAHMLQLAKFIQSKLAEGFDGAVITHGTDTLEETAFLLDLLHIANKPVIVTGAMRSSNEHGSDGPYNLISSVKVAASSESCGKGVLVVFNDEIHSAKNVTKTHTSNVATFQSPQFGPVGIVTKRDVFFHHTPVRSDFYRIESFSKKVVLLKAYAGMDGDIIRQISTGIDGLVIEALGQGNLPPAVMPEIKGLLSRSIPIVLVSRCFKGIVQDSYAYEGGGKQLKEAGVIFSNGLNGQKARLKLMAALEETNDALLLQQMFYRG